MSVVLPKHDTVHIRRNPLVGAKGQGQMSASRHQQKRWAGFADRDPSQGSLAPSRGLRTTRPASPVPESPPAESDNPLASSADPWERDLGEKYQSELASTLAAATDRHTSEINALADRHASELVQLETDLGNKYDAALRAHQAEVVTVPSDDAAHGTD